MTTKTYRLPGGVRRFNTILSDTPATSTHHHAFNDVASFLADNAGNI